MEKNFLGHLIVLFVVKFDFNLISSIVIFTSTFLESEDFNNKIKSIISYIPRGNVYPLVDQAVYFTPKISTISS